MDVGASAFSGAYEPYIELVDELGLEYRPVSPYVGHYARLGEFRFRSARADRTVVLCGEYLSAPHLSAATASGEAAAAALAAELATAVVHA